MEYNRDKVRTASLALVSQGLMTPSEAARIAGVSQQLMAFWIKREGIDWRQKRATRLMRYWKRETTRSITEKPLRKPTKAQLRAGTQALTANYLARGGEVKKCQ